MIGFKTTFMFIDDDYRTSEILVEGLKKFLTLCLRRTLYDLIYHESKEENCWLCNSLLGIWVLGCRCWVITFLTFLSPYQFFRKVY